MGKKHPVSSLFKNLPALVMRFIKYPPQVLYALGFGFLIGKIVLLLTTRGRKSGKARITPLQYEKIDDRLYVGSMRGTDADWYRNLIADPQVTVRLGRIYSRAIAHTVMDNKQIVAFLREKIRKHPKMMTALLKADGVHDLNDDTHLADYAVQIALVRLDLIEY